MSSHPPSIFDDKARTWDLDPDKLERARRVAEAIAAAVPDLSGLSLLEVGCGTGLLGLGLQPRVARVTLADSSREMLAVAEEKIRARGLGNATTAYFDLSEGPALDGRWDLVCSLMTLHHIPDIDTGLRVLHTLLAPGGWLCLADLDAEDGSFHGADFHGHHGFDRGDLASRLARAGFGGAQFSTVATMRRQDREFPVFLVVARRI